MACYIRQEGGDELVESGEFAETQVQRPPDQHSSIPPYISDEWSLLSKGLRGGKSRSDREVSLLRWMIAKRTKQIRIRVSSMHIGWAVFEGGSLDLPNSNRREAEGIAYPLHRPRF